MRTATLASILLILSAMLADSAPARPVDRNRTAPEGIRVPLAPRSPSQGAEYYFGGTTWAPDSMRWEAVLDSVWTFETGVGSHFQHSDPHKNPSLPAAVEGWTGLDLTAPSEEQRFRRLSTIDFSGTPCVGSPAGLGGQYSFWAGRLQEEADSLCWAGGQGYGDNWHICISKDFPYDDDGCLRIEYSFFNDSESGYDSTCVLVDTTGTGLSEGVLARGYTGTVDGTAGDVLDLQEGIDLRSDAGPIRIGFCFKSDGLYSDEDGYSPTSCGGFAVDDIVVSTTACGGSLVDVSDFEGGADGWEVEVPFQGFGDFSHLAAVADLPPRPDSLSCDLGDSVLVFFDPDAPPQQPHPLEQDNLAVSPWIDLRRAGVVGLPRKVVEIGGYFDIPYPSIFFAVWVQWYPDVCQETGKVQVSRWATPGLHGGAPSADIPTPTCDSLVLVEDVTALVPTGAEQIRIGLELVDPCSFGFGFPCLTENNTTPWFDHIRFGVGIEIVAAPPEETPAVVLPVLAVDRNPFRGSLAIRYEVPEGIQPTLRIYDVRGALVEDVGLSGSQGVATWDGAMRDGNAAPAGVYFLQLVAGGERRSLRVVRLQ